MLKILFIWFVFPFACGVKSNKPMQGEVQLNDCQKRWKILELTHQFQGKVLFHALASPSCGVLATGAVTIVQDNDGDTYRVIEYCNTDKNFAVGSSVIVRPQKNTNIPLSANDQQQCDLTETLFGSVEASN
jgi:hypothetical protein